MIYGKIDNLEITDQDISIKCFENLLIDPVIKTALLTTVAGYLEKDEITVNGPAFYDKEKLNKFCSYLLSDTRAAPRRFKLKYSFTGGQKKKNIIKADKNNMIRIMSFSGGLDSTAGILSVLDNNETVMPMWLGFGQKNESNELKAAEKICKKLNLNLITVKVDINKYIDNEWKRWREGIIPARNFLFACFAANLLDKKSNGGQILICAHKEEITKVNTDKSIRFFNMSSDILSNAYDKRIKVTSPFMNYTKPEIVRYWVKNWLNKYGISPTETISCYHGTNCGSCKACFNRALAFICAGLPLEKYAKHPINENQIVVKSYINRFNELMKERQLDLLFVLSSYGNYLPNDVKKFVDSRYKIDYDEILKRQNDIKEIAMVKNRNE